MRIFFVMLLVVNAAIYLWHRYDAGYAEIVQATVLPASKGNIVLLVERDHPASEPESVSRAQVAGAVGAAEGEVIAEGPVNDDAESRVAAQASRPVEPAVKEVECWALGPYSKAGLRGMPSGVVWRWEDYERDADYWVFLGPFDDFATGTRVSEALSKQRIDSYVVRRGELERAVSLGVFSDEGRAKKHRDRMRANGYTANIRKVSKTARRLWLVYEGKASSQDYARAIAYLRENAGDGRILEKKSCNRIASYQDFD